MKDHVPDPGPFVPGSEIDLRSFRNALLDGRFRVLSRVSFDADDERIRYQRIHDVQNTVGREACSVAESREIKSDDPTQRLFESEVVILSASQAREMVDIVGALIRRYGMFLRLADPVRLDVSPRDNA